MSSTVSIIDAGTYSYNDGERIKKAVFKALESLDINGDIIKPGMNILIKPNLVMDKNLNTEGGTECLYTQPVVVESVIEYILRFLNGKGSIIIGDAPMQECVFSNIKGYDELVEKYKDNSVTTKLVDFRELTSKFENGIHYSSITPDALGKIVNLGKSSEFYLSGCCDGEKMRVTNYDPRILPKHHHGDVHEYYVSEYILKSDLIINIPKPKTHRKGGVTIALKNLVGINTRKEFLPHHTVGSVREGGDEYLEKNILHAIRSRLLDKKNQYESDKKYKRAEAIKYLVEILSFILSKCKSKYAEGSWYGNDTISKTIVDLNKIARYADQNGIVRIKQQRQMIIVADMIISGECEGPVKPTPKPVGLIAAGLNSVCFDETIATIMGFDYRKIPSIVRARGSKTTCPLAGTESPIIISNNIRWDQKRLDELTRDDVLCFRPTSGWENHIELTI